MKTETIAVINQKGGVGKSTTVHTLAAGLTRRKYKILMVDLDPQGNLSAVVNVGGEKQNIISLLKGNAQCKEVIQPTKSCGDIIASEPGLMLANVFTGVDKEQWILSETTLKQILKPIKGIYDFILIDTPPALNILSLNALVASDSIIITMQANSFSFQGLAQIYQTVNSIRTLDLNPNLVIKGLLLTRYSKQTRLSRALTEKLEINATALNTILFKNRIRESVKIQEAQTKKQDIFSYAPYSNAAIDYNYFIDEVLNLGKGD